MLFAYIGAYFQDENVKYYWAMYVFAAAEVLGAAAVLFEIIVERKNKLL